MDNLFCIELLRSTNLVNSVQMSSPSNFENKNQKIESVMVSCIDNYGESQIKPPVAMCRLISPELSLNRLFEIAKEEHLKKVQNQ